MMTLTLENCSVRMLPQGAASVDYIGGSIYVPKDANSGRLKEGPAREVHLQIRLYHVRTSTGRNALALGVAGVVKVL